MTEDNPESHVAQLLAAKHAARRRAQGREPVDLERVARWLDGDLPAVEAEAMATRVATDPELAATVATLRELDPAPTEPANVIPFRRTVAQRPRSSLRGVLIGGGSVLAIAAIAFVATRPAPPASSEKGAGLAETTRVAATLSGKTGCALSGTLSAPGPRALWYVSEHGAVALGEHQPGAFSASPSCGPAACEAVVATMPGAPAPALDAVTCTPTEGAPGARLNR